MVAPEMIERVARTLADQDIRKSGVMLTVEPYWSPYVARACAMIEATLLDWLRDENNSYLFNLADTLDARLAALSQSGEGE